MKFKLLFLLIPIVLITSRITCSIIPTSTVSNLKKSTDKFYASCKTQSCNDAVETMVEYIDSKVDPCDDFYQFTCGSYINSTNVPNPVDKLNWVEKISVKIEKQLTSSLEKDIVANDTDPEKIAKYLYQTCVNESAIEEQGLTPFLDIMEQVGGWPVLKENQSWNETAFNWKKVVFKIGNARMWSNILLPIEPFQNSINLTQFDIVVDEPKLRIPVNVLKDGINNKKVQRYFKYMVDMAVSMGASKSYATKELKEILHFEIKLLNITLAGKMDSDPYLHRTNYMDLLDKPITIPELMKNYSSIPWADYIKHQLPFNATLDEINDRIIVSNLNYISDLKDLIESTPKRVVANYIMWVTFDGYAYHLKKGIRDLFVNYENSIKDNDLNTISIPRTRECYEYILLTMPLVLSIIYVREHFDKNTERNVNIILNNVQDEYVELLKNASWMDEVTRNRRIDKVMSTNRVIGYSKELLDDSITNKYLQDLKFIKDNYIANLCISYTYWKKLSWKVFDRIAFHETKRLAIFRQMPWLSVTPVYYSDFNVLFAPAGSLQTPMYSYSLPTYMNYGKIGFVLGHELGRGFDIARRKFGKNNTIVHCSRPWPNATEKAYTEYAQCILKQNSNYSEVWIVESTQNEDISDNIGMKVAYHAYKKLSKIDKSETIKGKVYTPKQMFWISYATMICGLQANDIAHSSSKNQIIAPLSNMKEFADDFKCPIGSPMNPPKKCHLF